MPQLYYLAQIGEIKKVYLIKEGYIETKDYRAAENDSYYAYASRCQYCIDCLPELVFEHELDATKKSLELLKISYQKKIEELLSRLFKLNEDYQKLTKELEKKIGGAK